MPDNERKIEYAHDLGIGMKKVWDQIFLDMDEREGIKETFIKNISNPDLDPRLFFDNLGNLIDAMEVSDEDREGALIRYLHQQIIRYKSWFPYYTKHKNDRNVQIIDAGAREEVLNAFSVVYPEVRLVYNRRNRKTKADLLSIMKNYASSAQPVVSKELGSEIDKQFAREMGESDVEDDEAEIREENKKKFHDIGDDDE